LMTEVGFWETMKQTALQGLKAKYDAQSGGANAFKMAKKLIETVFDYPEVRQDIVHLTFVNLDTDKSGTISKQEFMNGYVFSNSKDLTKKADIIFHLWDEDNNGTLSRDEIKRKLELSLELTFRMTASMTSAMLGVICLDLIEQANQTPSKKRKARQMEALRWVVTTVHPLIQTYMEATQKQIDSTPIVDKIIELADTDKNGVLSREEWIEYSTNPAVQAQVVAVSRACGEKAAGGMDNEKVSSVIDHLFDEFPRRFPN